MNSFKYIMKFTLFVLYLVFMSGITLANDDYPIPYMYPDWWYVDYWGNDYLYLGVDQEGTFEDDGSYDPDNEYGSGIEAWFWGVYDSEDDEWWEHIDYEEYYYSYNDFEYMFDTPGYYYVRLYVMDDEDIWSDFSPIEDDWFDWCEVCVVDVDIENPSNYSVGVDQDFPLECEPLPSEATGGVFNWSVTSGTATFSPDNSTNADETDFSSEQVGEYEVNVTYTLEGASASDTLATHIKVVEIDKVKIDGVANYGPVFVSPGTTVYLETELTPSGASFPDDEPTWLFDSQPGGGSLTFNPAHGQGTQTLTGLSQLGTYRVRARYGNSSSDGDYIDISVIDVEITEPDNDPQYDYQFAFNDASPGVCTIGAEGTTGITALDNDLEWDITTIADSTLTSNPNPPEGDSVTFTYTGLPSSNSGFGLKTLTLEYDDTGIQDTKDVEIFYEKLATNNPGNNPNWFYYWGEQNGAVPEIYSQSFEFEDVEGSGLYNPYTVTLYLYRWAPDHYTVLDEWTNLYWQTSINTGQDGICDTNAVPDDFQVIKRNWGEPNQVAITAGNDGILQTAKSGDDKIEGTTIITGVNGICETEPNASSDDEYMVYGSIPMELGHGKPYTTCITADTDGFLHSADNSNGSLRVGEPINNDVWDLTNALKVQWSIQSTDLQHCAITCTHEMKHKEIHQQWTTGDDDDQDGVRNPYEASFTLDSPNPENPRLDPKRKKTFKAYDEEVEQGLLNDNEFIAYMTQESGSEDPDKDWTKYGEQWGQ